ncbi:MAG TPA: hypothetical protein VK927_03605, partial [Adhaeribacter sp.]|nr:hypothetical protein [Adhaeribacter sp.]
MKKNLTFKTALGILCGVLLLAETATMAQAQSTTTFSRPGNSMNYDHDGNSWYLVSYSDYTYNAEGNLLLQVNTTPNANQPFSKTEITYDAQGNE